MKFLKSIFGAKPTQTTAPTLPFTAALEPETPVFIIGDVHGRADLLESLIAQKPNAAQLIFVGDLVDRGEQSAQTLALVKQQCETAGAICLMGNHERMMLDFIDRPTESGPRWLRNGGLQTLQSYNIRGIFERAGEAELLAARDSLVAEMPNGMDNWLRALPLQWATGNLHVVHAAAKPDLPMNLQAEKNLLWGASTFETHTRQDGQWVVHGHTIVDMAQINNGRISIDTGAYATGKLTAVNIAQNNGTWHADFVTAH